MGIERTTLNLPSGLCAPLRRSTSNRRNSAYKLAGNIQLFLGLAWVVFSLKALPGFFLVILFSRKENGAHATNYVRTKGLFGKQNMIYENKKYLGISLITVLKKEGASFEVPGTHIKHERSCTRTCTAIESLKNCLDFF